MRSSIKGIWAIKNSAKLNYYTGSAAVSIDSNYMHVSMFVRVLEKSEIQLKKDKKKLLKIKRKE